jgi:aminoglycoside phosphotransferase (APT) family kinase protein
VPGLDIEDPDQLVAWLRRTGRIDASESPAVRRLAGGVSNRAMVVERPGGGAWVVKQALEQLRVDVVWRSSPERIHREAAGLRWVAELCGPETVPALVFEDFDEHAIAMHYVPEPHDGLKALLLAGRIDLAHMRAFGALLARIHERAASRLDDLRGELGDRGFFESLRVEPYYSYSAERCPAAAGFLDALVAETRATAVTLVHGDYSPKNVLVRESRLVLLDHEVMHIGDPAFDVGFSMTHLLSKAHAAPAYRSAFAAAAREHWSAYAAGVRGCAWAGDGLEARAARHTLGCLLARAVGRSPLEYLDGAQRAHQRDAVVSLAGRPPERMEDLIDAFLGRLP